VKRSVVTYFVNLIDMLLQIVFPFDYRAANFASNTQALCRKMGPFFVRPEKEISGGLSFMRNKTPTSDRIYP